jgi:hypothetical protein
MDKEEARYMKPGKSLALALPLSKIFLSFVTLGAESITLNVFFMMGKSSGLRFYTV